MKAIASIISVVAAAAGLPACGPSSDMKDMDKTASKESAMKSMDMQKKDMKGMDMKEMESAAKAQGTVHNAVGVVKNVDPAGSTVTLDHEPVKSLEWSAMTMTFAVKDKALLDRLQTGKKVEFEFVQQGKDNIITAVK